MNTRLIQHNLCVFLIFCLSHTLSAQSTLTGIVTDKQGNPLPGTTLLVQESTNGTLTDEEGLFTLSKQGMKDEFILVVYHKKYKSPKIPINQDIRLLEIRLKKRPWPNRAIRKVAKIVTFKG